MVDKDIKELEALEVGDLDEIEELDVSDSVSLPEAGASYLCVACCSLCCCCCAV